MIAKQIEEALKDLRNDEQATQLSRYFKTAPGEYGYGDSFLGIRVPSVRAIVKQYRTNAEVEDFKYLVQSPWHEIRLAAFLLLLEIYNHQKKKKLRDAESVVQLYIENLRYGNNWDLVDLVAPNILGDWLVSHPHERYILLSLSDSDILWEQRVAIVSTLALVRKGIFDPTLELAGRFLAHPHDLMHKATGWLLREVGKYGGRDRLEDFLERYADVMPRTSLRYALEHFEPEEKLYYMSLKKKNIKQ
ncbi:MAG: DNA alkylation repair protein [Muribaculaceae bacterium]|nr:DNA alkylation repair protein [Muribaculaceae bacterium]